MIKERFEERKNILTGKISQFPEGCDTVLKEAGYIVKQTNIDCPEKVRNYINFVLNLSSWLIDNPDVKMIPLHMYEDIFDEFLNRSAIYIHGEAVIDVKEFIESILQYLDENKAFDEKVAIFAALRYIGITFNYHEEIHGAMNNPGILESIKKFELLNHIHVLKSDANKINAKLDEVEKLVIGMFNNNENYKNLQAIHKNIVEMWNRSNKPIVKGSDMDYNISVFDTGPRVDIKDQFLLTQFVINEEIYIYPHCICTPTIGIFMDAQHVFYKKVMDKFYNKIGNKINLISESVILPSDMTSHELENHNDMFSLEFNDTYFSADEYIMALSRYARLCQEHLNEIIDDLSFAVIKSYGSLFEQKGL